MQAKKNCQKKLEKDTKQNSRAFLVLRENYRMKAKKICLSKPRKNQKLETIVCF